MKIFEGARVPIKSWCESPEEGAVEQARNLTKLPFIFKQVCLMPDTHQGYGMPIGGVIACEKVVIPNAVGVDIGCGMGAVKTNLTNISTEDLKAIMAEIRKRVPVGFNHHKVPQPWSGFEEAPDIDIVLSELSSAEYQLGTLGGGNHFIEIQRGSDGYIWYMIHSGSRNFGYKIAKFYNKKAQALCKLWHSNIPQYKGEDGLAFLPVDTQEGREYIIALNYALSFAKASRKFMLNNVGFSFAKVINGSALKTVTSNDEFRYIDIHHNYAALEGHFGRNVWVHRKGATSAKSGELGIIPGSQGTKSYIVRGKGARESFMSCSHGAGRKMSRTKARQTLNIAEEKKKMEDAGIIHSIRTEKDLDEAASAYKDIDVVMQEQVDLVDIVVELSPLAVIKG